jgi:hypothetical protein
LSQKDRHSTPRAAGANTATAKTQNNHAPIAATTGATNDKRQTRSDFERTAPEWPARLFGFGAIAWDVWIASTCQLFATARLDRWIAKKSPRVTPIQADQRRNGKDWKNHNPKTIHLRAAGF